MWLSCESRQGRLAPESVLLTTALHSLKFTVGPSWVGVLSKTFLLFKSLLRLYTDISLCDKEDLPSSEDEVVHVDTAPQALGYRVLLGDSMSALS